MKLKYLRILNLRCIEEIELNVFEFTSLIGPNNSGKSTILRAVELLLKNSKPEKEEWRIEHEDEDIIIEAHFDDIKDWERNMPGIAGIVNQNEIRLRYVCSIIEGSVKTRYEANIRPIEIAGWNESWGQLEQELKTIAEGLEINGQKWRTKANKELVRQRVIETLPDRCTEQEEIWTSENISIPQALQQALPQVVFIPAVQDASDAARTSNTSSFGTLLNTLILPALQESPEYQNLIQAVDALSNKLNLSGDDQIEEIQQIINQISGRITSIIEASIRLSISTPDTSKFIGSNTKILVDDGVETPIHLQGHDIQRALIFALIEVIAKLKANEVDGDENIKASILLFEEPELYLHPHLMRRLKKSLQTISKNDQWQVLISTHSPFLIDVIDEPQSLVILSKETKETPPSKKQLETNPFEGEGFQNEKVALRASLDFHPTANEAFFADRVVLVEGDTELSIFNHQCNPHLKFNITQELCDMTTIVSCGGKWTIPAMARLLSLFGVPFRVIHDLDKKGLTEEEILEIHPLHPFNANAKIQAASGEAQIFVNDDTLEHILWDPNNSVSPKEKPLKSWRKIKEYIEGDGNVHNEEQLEAMFKFTYEW